METCTHFILILSLFFSSLNDNSKWRQAFNANVGASVGTLYLNHIATSLILVSFTSHYILWFKSHVSTNGVLRFSNMSKNPLDYEPLQNPSIGRVCPFLTGLCWPASVISYDRCPTGLYRWVVARQGASIFPSRSAAHFSPSAPHQPFPLP